MNSVKKSTAKKRTALISRSSIDWESAPEFLSSESCRITDSTLHRSNLSGCGVIQGCN